MTIRKNEILKLLKIIKIYDKKNGASIGYVQKTFNDEPVKKARLPNYFEVEDFCISLKLIEKETTIKILENAQLLLDLENDSEEINKKIIDFCFDSLYSEKILNMINQFNINENNIKWYPKWAVYDLIDTPEILPILYDTNFLVKTELAVQLNPNYNSILDRHFEKSHKLRKITQKQLEISLRIKGEIGQIGEKIAFVYEQKRLRLADCVGESKNIEIISQNFANAGYDIQSFAGKTESMKHDRFIEVKSSSNQNFDFFWSKNELNTAKKLGEQYWIYFIPNIDLKTKTSDSSLIMIQNPFKNIFENDEFSKESESYHITKKS